MNDVVKSFVEIGKGGAVRFVQPRHFFFICHFAQNTGCNPAEAVLCLYA